MQFGFRRVLALLVLSISLVGAALIPHPPRAEANGSGMQLVFNTPGMNKTVRIGLGGYANLSIDWGDGSVVSSLNSPGNVVHTHTYTTDGPHNVYISGTSLTRFGDCNPPGIDDTLTKVTSWGAFALEDLSCAFSYRYAIDQVPGSIPATVTNLHRIFENTGDFDQNLNGWSTANVTDMSNAFSMTAAFNNGGEPLSWNTANVENMNKMFHYAGAFNADVSGFDTSKVTDMSYMFSSAQVFNQSLAGWDISRVQYMVNMFSADPAGSGYNYSLSDANYSSTLIGWASRTVQSGVSLDAPANKATGCEAVAARTVLTSTPNNWTITDISPTDVVPAGGCPQPSPPNPALADTGSESLTILVMGLGALGIGIVALLVIFVVRRRKLYPARNSFRLSK